MKYNSVIAVEFTNSSNEPAVTRDDTKVFCKIDLPDDDAVVDQLIKSATTILENHLNTSLIPKTVKAKITNGLGDCYLPLGPVKEITVLKECGNDVDLALAGLLKDVISEPKSQDVYVEYTTGFDELPEVYKTAIMEQVFYMYNNREMRESLAPAAQLTLSGLCRPKD